MSEHRDHADQDPEADGLCAYCLRDSVTRLRDENIKLKARIGEETTAALVAATARISELEAALAAVIKERDELIQQQSEHAEEIADLKAKLRAPVADEFSDEVREAEASIKMIEERCVNPKMEVGLGCAQILRESREVLARALRSKTAALAERDAQVARLVEVKNGAYSERNKLVAALTRIFPANLERHDGKDWEDDWRWVVFIDLPTGQASWHLHDSEMPNFIHLAREAGRKWDGHSNEEKYARLAAIPMLRAPVGHQEDGEFAASIKRAHEGLGRWESFPNPSDARDRELIYRAYRSKTAALAEARKALEELAQHRSEYPAHHVRDTASAALARISEEGKP